MKLKSYLAFLSVALIALAAGLIPLFSNIPRAAGQESTPVSCTFTANYPAINLRAGPGTSYERLGKISFGETLSITGRGVGSDGYVWWKAGENWVRSDLGTSDCPSLCGDTVCEYGETASSCAKDCGTSTAGSSSGGTGTGTTSAEGCDFVSCEACYEAFPCWPNPCTKTECTFNEFGCPSCTTAP